MLGQQLLPDVHLPRATFGAAHARGWARHLAICIHRALCGMRGHDLLLHFEPRRMCLKCVDCGWESPGWTIDRPRYAYTSVQHRANAGRTLTRVERRFVMQPIRGGHSRVAEQAPATREAERLAG